MYLYPYYRIKNMFNNTSQKWDLMSCPLNDAIPFAHEHINPEPSVMIPGTDKYTPEYLLAHFGGDYCKQMRDDNPTDYIMHDVAGMIAQHTCNTDLILYRGVWQHVFKNMVNNAKELDNIDLCDRAFSSTSLVKGQEPQNRPYHLRIFVPAGTNVVYLGNVNNEQHYYEVVIQYGGQFRIISADHYYINCLLLRTSNLQNNLT